MYCYCYLLLFLQIDNRSDNRIYQLIQRKGQQLVLVTVTCQPDVDKLSFLTQSYHEAVTVIVCHHLLSKDPKTCYLLPVTCYDHYQHPTPGRPVVHWGAGLCRAVLCHGDGRRCLQIFIFHVFRRGVVLCSLSYSSWYIPCSLQLGNYQHVLLLVV